MPQHMYLLPYSILSMATVTLTELEPNKFYNLGYVNYLSKVFYYGH